MEDYIDKSLKLMLRSMFLKGGISALNKSEEGYEKMETKFVKEIRHLFKELT